MSQRISTGWRANLAPVTGKVVVYTTLFAFCAHAAIAAVPGDPQNTARPTTYGNEEREIPQTPSAPPSLLQSAPADPFHCHRIIVFQGKPIDCDSNVRRDGNNLRKIIKDVPSAVSELDTYQRNRRNLKYWAYAASSGLLVTLVGYFGSRGPQGFRRSDSSLTPAAIIALSGLSFSVGSMLIGFYVYQSNESHLTASINDFNLARPNTPIDFEFKTGIHF